MQLHPCLPSDLPEVPVPVHPSTAARPVVWSVAGTDSGGGAGLAADQRAAEAVGVHLCPVVAAVTAQNSVGVRAVYPLSPEQLDAQLQALGEDLPPSAIKTGLLGSAELIEVLCRHVDRWRASRPVRLVVDPVLGASSGGAAFANEAVLQAYRSLLLPRADLVTPNRREAERLLAASGLPIPTLAQALQARFTPDGAVCITGGDDLDALPDARALALDWLQAHVQVPTKESLAPHEDQGRAHDRAESLGTGPAQRRIDVQGWLALPRLDTPHTHGTGCTFASAAAALLACGFPVPDAVVQAKHLTWHALRRGHAAGAGAGPVKANTDVWQAPGPFPLMGFDDELTPDTDTLHRWRQVLDGQHRPSFAPGLYGITDHAERVGPLAASGHLAHLQLRIKASAALSPDDLRARIEAACQSAAAHPNVTFWVNDHWAQALEAGAQALHLGQEDWGRLTAADRQCLRAPGVRLGLSSHSLWELARARGVAPDYIACGPVWPTTTKDMPWHPQGLGHVAAWATWAGVPMVAIGGILQPEQAHQAFAAGAAAICLVRGLDSPAHLQQFLPPQGT